MSEAVTSTEAVDWNDWEVTVTTEQKTGIRLFRVKRPDSNLSVIFAEFNSNFDVHAAPAWAAARSSRSDSDFKDIFAEIKMAADEGRTVSGPKLASFFVKYGHASVAGMAPVFLYINKVPLFMPFWLFNHTAVGDGQESSTRFIKLTDLGITPLAELMPLHQARPEISHELERRWLEMQDYLVSRYNKWYPLIEAGYKKQFDKVEDPISESTMNARVLDFVRLFLPAGAETSMAQLASVRVWIDYVSQLRETGFPPYIELAEQINAALNLSTHPNLDIQADLAGLTKYSSARMTVTRNTENLRLRLQDFPDFLDIISRSAATSTGGSEVGHISIPDPGVSLLMQYIITIYPTLDEFIVARWLNNLDDDTKAEFGRIVLEGHNQHDTLHIAGDMRDGSFIFTTAMAYVRDLNRHRAYQRLIALLEAKNFDAILQEGFHMPIQLSNTDSLKYLKDEYAHDMRGYYQMLSEFHSLAKQSGVHYDHRILLYMLPLAHQTRVQMSSSTKQHFYMEYQRYAEGGDIGYRDVVQKMSVYFRESSAFFRDVMDFEPVDPNSRAEFKSRK